MFIVPFIFVHFCKSHIMVSGIPVVFGKSRKGGDDDEHLLLSWYQKNGSIVFVKLQI